MNNTIAKTADGRINYEAYTGLHGFIEHDELQYPVTVKGARLRYGHLDLLVSPVQGKGERWVQRTRVYLAHDPADSNVLTVAETPTHP